MKAQTVDIKESAVEFLCCTIFRSGGRKLLAKGHVLNQEDVRLLETEGLGQVGLPSLRLGKIARTTGMPGRAEMGCGCLEIRLAAGGRANLFSTEDCCVLVDDELLKQINCTSSVVIATSPNFASRGRAAHRNGKERAVRGSRSQLDIIISILRERGPILRPGPFEARRLGSLYRSGPRRSRQTIVRPASCAKRLERSGWPPVSSLRAKRKNKRWPVACNTCCEPSPPWR